MLFAGTAVANGACRGVVNAIGMGTEVGAIQQQITEAAAEEEDTPLKKKLDAFGEALAQARFVLLSVFTFVCEQCSSSLHSRRSCMYSARRSRRRACHFFSPAEHRL
jgi:magnesium-transporting ATPase (P-type)